MSDYLTLELKHSYQGRRTNEQLIPAGVYLETDERLFGLAHFLVDNGHAVWVEGEPVETAPEPVAEEDEIEHKGRVVKRRRAKA